jgi:trypsin-like peptidase
MTFKELEDAVLLLLCSVESSGDLSQGTAFAVGDGSLVVTAAHVVKGHETCVVLRGAASRDHWASRGRIVFLDEEIDVGVVKVEKVAPRVLHLEEYRRPTEKDHLVVWDWPAWQGATKPVLERNAEPRALAALFTSEWESRSGGRRFGFAARLEHGMSGVPVLLAGSAHVLGLVLGSWRVDEEEVVENWWANVGASFGPSAGIDGQQRRESMKAHLALSMGIAVPAESISRVLRSVP